MPLGLEPVALPHHSIDVHVAGVGRRRDLGSRTLALAVGLLPVGVGTEDVAHLGRLVGCEGPAAKVTDRVTGEPSSSSGNSIA